MGEKRATRAGYGEELAVLGAEYPNVVVLDADLSHSTMSYMFADKYPDRFFNCGIAEANMTSIAAGMAACGLIPFTNSFAMFAAGRAYEQIRNSVAYPNLNVKIVGSHGGPSVGEDGATHQCNEDIAIMRSIPNMTVVVPCDAHEMKLAVRALVEYNGPCYLRMSRFATETVTDELENYTFELGKGTVLHDGSDVTVIATGIMVPMSITAAKALKDEGISVRVIDMHTVKPLDREIVLKAARETGAIVTAEEASTVGGLGSAVAEVLSEECPTPLVRHGVPDVFGRSGTAAQMLEYYGLTPQGIAEKVRLALAKKAR